MVDKPKVKKPKVKPKLEPEPETEQPKPTLKQRIDEVVDKISEIDEKSSIELKKELFILFQRVLYPNQFCPTCDERLFFGPTGWSCPNCGFQGQPSQAVQQGTDRPSQSGKVPPQVEKMIQQSQQNMKSSRRVNAPTKMGDKIRKLVDKRDSGGAGGPTQEDEAKVRGDRNVGTGKINWV